MQPKVIPKFDRVPQLRKITINNLFDRLFLMPTIPEYLNQGDVIGMICPSGYMPLEKAQKCINTLKEWGFKVKIGKTVGNQYNYFSGTDEERLTDLQIMLDDENLKAVFCARGGYGLSRIIDKINFDRFVEKPKWILGYSDITLLHMHVFSSYNIVSLHAPMAAAFNEVYESEKYLQSIYKSLIGQQQPYKVNVHNLNRIGNCEGELIGGNLALLAHCVGSKSDINTINKILFIEDIGEYKYNIDRMLIQMKRAGKFDNLAGLIVGRFTEIKDTAIPFGQSIEEIVFDKIKEYNYPVCFGFPIGHTTDNYALKFGINYKLVIDFKKVILNELE